MKNKISTGYYVLIIFYMILSIYAAFLSYHCNNNKINLWEFIIALLFPYLYILYKAGTQGLCNI